MGGTIGLKGKRGAPFLHRQNGRLSCDKFYKSKKSKKYKGKNRQKVEIFCLIEVQLDYTSWSIEKQGGISKFFGGEGSA